MIKIFGRLIVGCLFIGHVYGQQDFNHFEPLISVGEIPSDFFVRTSEKIEEDMKTSKENLSQREQKVFLDGIHHGIDEILQSGLVIYGDEISKYVEKVANKLLEKDPKLRKKLRFYTVKSNVSNAFSTDQGIIFVTTGLISQITSESHLAYILAHEIAHYVEKHVVEGFEYRTRNKGINRQILQLSVYSKEKEFEADSLGVKLYQKAGYSRNFINSTFDVLMYSYLPIDEIEFRKDYFNSPLCYIPEHKFADKDYAIKVEEDYDDSKSSHPNIRKRKEKATSVADETKNWGDIESHFGKELFLYVRNLARFERVRSDIIEYQYANALYTIYILEKEFPNSIYLARMKAQCWYGLSVMKQANKINKSIDSRKDLEGEGAGMHVFLKNLRENEMATLAVRVVEDCRKRHPEDKEINELAKRTNKTLFTSDKFNIDNYSKYNFQTAVEKSLVKDSVAAEIKDSIDERKLSKYEKIKLKRTGSIDPAAFDTTNFYLYMLSDLMADEAFLTLNTNTQLEKEDLRAKEEAYDKMSRSERITYDKEEAKLQKDKNKVDLQEFILVDPAVISYKKGKVDRSGSEEMEEHVVEGFQHVADLLNLKMTTVGKGNLAQIGTDGFNNKSFFTSLLIQMANAEGVEVFPVDYGRISAISQEFGTNKLVFSVVEHEYRPRFSPYALYFIFFPPGILAYIPVPFIKGNETELNLIVVDLDSAKVVTGASYYFQEPLNKYTIENRLYDIFQQNNSSK